MPGLRAYHEDVLSLAPAAIRYVDADLVFARLDDGAIYELAFGDAVTAIETSSKTTNFSIVGGRFHGVRARIDGALPVRKTPILRLSMIDVQQGDGLVLDTPGGQILTIDGGDNQLFARHLAARFAGTSAVKPLPIDAMIVTHGDADHFAGLAEIVASEEIKSTPEEPDRAKKRLFVNPERLFHNGLVKRPSAVPEKESFGAAREFGDALYITGLVESPLDTPRAEMNKPFQVWADALAFWNLRRTSRGEPPIAIRRLDQTRGKLLKPLAEPGLKFEILGPIMEKKGGADALAFLRAPAKDVELHLSDKRATGAYSASHTINGHSIAFRLVYKKVRMLFTGDMNHDSLERLRAARPNADLEAEILKTPHHGSADFSFRFLKNVRPVVSIVSSGDESAKKEYIHPRATLVSALGRAARGDTGIVFMTELAAFFQQRGYAKALKGDAKPFFAFERTNFGIIHIRTDGDRVLAFTHSGKRGMNEAYGFTVDAEGGIEMTKKLVVARAGRED